MVWKEGMKSWEAADTLTELAGIFPPPLPLLNATPPALIMEENILITMLADNVAKWKKLVAEIEREKSNFIQDENKLFQSLRDFWRINNFAPDKCKQLLNEIAVYKAKHPASDFKENLQEFRGLCNGYYTKDKAVFEAFQKAMGGKIKLEIAPKPRPKPKPIIQQDVEQPKKTSNTINWLGVIGSLVFVLGGIFMSIVDGVSFESVAVIIFFGICFFGYIWRINS
jgi:hypothetical protein